MAVNVLVQRGCPGATRRAPRPPPAAAPATRNRPRRAVAPGVRHLVGRLIGAPFVLLGLTALDFFGPAAARPKSLPRNLLGPACGADLDQIYFHLDFGARVRLAGVPADPRHVAARRADGSFAARRSDGHQDVGTGSASASGARTQPFRTGHARSRRRRCWATACRCTWWRSGSWCSSTRPSDACTSRLLRRQGPSAVAFQQPLAVAADAARPVARPSGAAPRRCAPG